MAIAKVIEQTEYTITYTRDGETKKVVLTDFDDVMMFTGHLNKLGTPFDLTRKVTVDTVDDGVEDGDLEGFHVG